MSRTGEWDSNQVIEEAAKIENAARHGDASKAFRDEDVSITRSSNDPEVRRANAARVTAQLEKDGFLPVCGFDLAKANGVQYRRPTCDDSPLGGSSNSLTDSPSESIERSIYSREQIATDQGKDLQFGSNRPAVPREQEPERPKVKDEAPAKSDEKGGEKDTMKAILEELRSMRKENETLRKELEELKSGKKHPDTAADGKSDHSKEVKPDRLNEKTAPKVENHDSKPKADGHDTKPHNVPKSTHPGDKDKHEKQPSKHHDNAAEVAKAKQIEAAKELEAAKAQEQAVARTLLQQMVGKIDLSVAAQRMNKSDGVKQSEVTANVSVTANKDGSMHIAGEPYGTIDLDAKANLKIEQDGSILATDSKGTKYHFLSKPDDHAMLLETTDKENNVLRKYAPNNEKLISEQITQDKDGGYTSVKQFNKNEVPYAEYFYGQKLTNPLNTNRGDWITATTAVYDKDKNLKTEIVDYGKSGYKEAGEIRKVQEIFHYDHGKVPDKGLYAEHIYDNGYKFSELSSGQTYIQRRVVAQDKDPVKFEHQSEKHGNGSVKYHGVDWALSNKQLRPGIHILRTQRDLPESYWNWSDEGELKP